ncbi:MAG TPA: NADH-ubiquinone oxidoreductase-F iron-sulfur binding region domain-containing protein [Jatrophihabitans sp.]|nr:NADH-ubiquinone oxidoreductase-F iron-sulfur binding region domain-containing protein [Jatrophihabitans sp.]
MTAILPGTRPSGLVPVRALGMAPRLLAAPPAAAPPPYSRAGLLDLLDAVNLTGRGGAGFPLASKLRALRPGAKPVVVINAAEGEPVSAKDHALLQHNPQLVLDGARVAASAIGARRIILAVTDAVLAARLRPQLPRDIELRRVPERFIAGEARALISALNGGDGLPPGRRVLPTEAGVQGRPTLLSNVETFAQLALLARLGPARYAELGVAGEPGSTLVTVSGAVARPGVYELPLGYRLADLAHQVGAGASQAVITGGYHGTWLPPIDLTLSRQGVSAAGGVFGAGVLVFVGEGTCALAELTRVAAWLAGESARQCGPCRFGLPALAADLAGLLQGAPSGPALDRHARQVAGRGACAHPDGAVRFIRSALGVLASELDAHCYRGGCGRPDRGQLAIIRATSGRPA